jgi:hypothetical protein
MCERVPWDAWNVSADRALPDVWINTGGSRGWALLVVGVVPERDYLLGNNTQFGHLSPPKDLFELGPFLAVPESVFW